MEGGTPALPARLATSALVTDVTFTCVVVIWKGWALSLKENKIPYDLYFINYSLQPDLLKNIQNIQESGDLSIDFFRFILEAQIHLFVFLPMALATLSPW